MTKIKAEVKNLATDIRSENVSGQDVTAEYTDLTSRRNNLERAEAQLQEIMASATKTEDVLNVFNQLTQIRGEIEVIKGQMKYYEESSNFSAINVELISQESDQTDHSSRVAATGCSPRRSPGIDQYIQNLGKYTHLPGYPGSPYSAGSIWCCQITDLALQTAIPEKKAQKSE